MPSKAYYWCLIAWIGISATCHAGLPEIPPAPTAQAVSELLLLDAQQALAIERSRPGASSAKATNAPELTLHTNHALPMSQAPKPALASIQGVGQRLRARVILDGHSLVFATGHTQALSGPTTAWRLKRIAPPCIDLESPTHGAMRLCANTAEAMP